MRKLSLILLGLMGCQGWFNSVSDKTPPRNNPAILIDPIKDPTPALSVPIASLNPICAKIMALKEPSPLRSVAELKERFLKSHNEIRKLYDLPALQWSDELAQYAQNWANYLRDNKQCKMHHRSALNMSEGRQYGENLAWNWISISVPEGSFSGSPEKANLNWSKECQDYDYNLNSCSAGKMCGHFTQVVWRQTQMVGCGLAICDERDKSLTEGHSEVWVCNYSPPGNVTVIYPDGRREAQKPF